ncbi:MAG: hypothetical protein A2Y06_04345 [Omnitrophica WOR_2 bacterium GWA2_37_7]|nr:MAG: hypothetical protein A2Y06_04345 [Omnitrophica WOR_2 bacterium GWA2_37_7]OGX48104.1 MAG: hypothetical protein A2243_02800 [Omnitrophica WOR_2 bacterium RIFOXYA2_FULL_38_17]
MKTKLILAISYMFLMSTLNVYAQEVHEGLLLLKKWGSVKKSFYNVGGSYYKLCTDKKQIAKIKSGEKSDCGGSDIESLILGVVDDNVNKLLSDHVGKIIRVKGKWQEEDKAALIESEDAKVGEELEDIFVSKEDGLEYRSFVLIDEADRLKRQASQAGYALPLHAGQFVVSELQELDK